MSKATAVIGDVCEFVGGSQPPKSTFIYEPRDGYVRLIQTRDYKTDEYRTYIPSESTSKFCNEDDIMIGRYGPPIFQICRGLQGAYNVALMKAVPKPCMRNLYLYYLLKQPTILAYIERLSLRTGGQTGVDLASLRNYPVLLPSLGMQHRIERVLGDLDDKISVNNSINAELQGMAKLLFNYWFVQFDFPMSPSQAQAIGQPGLVGKPYHSSGGRMVYIESLNREIPVDWTFCCLGDICKNIRDTVDPASVEPGTPYVGLEHVPRRKFFLDDWCVSESVTSLKSRFNVGDILFGKLRPYFHKVVKAPIQGICTSELLVLRPKNHLYEALVGSVLFSDSFVESTSKQWGGAQMPRADWKRMEKFALPLPTEELLSEFNSHVLPLWKFGGENQKQNMELSRLRDWLLPMLMSGQVTVGE